MEFDNIIVKENPGLCRCCLSEGCYKELGTEYPWMDETEVYADMLLECFDISISQHIEGPNGTNRLICEVCITRLRDACNFKKQVMDCEKKFVDMIGRGEFKQKALPIEGPNMKSEINLEEHTDVVTEIEYLEDGIDYDDDKDDPTQDITVETLPVKPKRGRPKKNAAKVEKKAKEEKPRTSKSTPKGAKRPELATEAWSKSSLSSTKRNRLMKRNAMNILECSTVVPFKWHRHSYLCFFCHRIFKDFQTLKHHTANDHQKASIKSAVSYLKRDEKVKIDVSTIACRVCDKDIDDLKALIEHSKTEHNRLFDEDYGYGVIPYNLGDIFQCALCDQSFEYFIKLNQHMNSHYGNYVCELCGKSFLSQDRLRSHALSHGTSFRCNVCTETFESLTQKSRHESKAHNRGATVKCLFCPETFPNYAARKRHHVAAHRVDAPAINCPVCGKTFQIHSKMRVHLKEVHLREKNFSCPMCERSFFSRTHVQRHMVKHSGERIHGCGVCGKSYARKQTLRDHMRIHSDERRFACAVCDQAFVQNNSLRLHMKVHHSGSV